MKSALKPALTSAIKPGIKQRIRQLKFALIATAIAIAGCSALKQTLDNKAAITADGSSTATTVEEYKRELGQRIQQVNSTKVYIDRPQALLRAVIVVKFVVDAEGALVRSEFMRSNHDKTAESLAMATLRNTAPFPKPPPSLLKGGHLEMSETWLFNNDGRFQIRSVALQQMDR